MIEKLSNELKKLIKIVYRFVARGNEVSPCFFVVYILGTYAVSNPAIILHSSHAELVSANFCTAFMPDSENIEPIGQ